MFTETQKLEINAKLAREGLRLAGPDESGWYYSVRFNGESRKVWVTDAPAQERYGLGYMQGRGAA